MIKFLTLVTLIVTFAACAYAEKDAGPIPGFGTPPQFGDELLEGSFHDVGFAQCQGSSGQNFTYDECTSFCCGGKIITNATDVDCCGSMQFGSPYNTRYRKCCSWWTGHGAAHSKFWRHHNIGCCGTELINWARQACCYGSIGPPQVFDWKRQICCDSHAVNAVTRDPHMSSCCGVKRSYDKRGQSCPCNDGTVLDVSEEKSECCENDLGEKSAYVIAKEICCNGQVGNRETHFCCLDNDLGEYGKSVCCEDGLRDAVNATNRACCDGQPFNEDTHLCCDGELIPHKNGETQCCGKQAYDPEQSLCCEGERTWSREMGDACCGRYPFFTEENSKQFCCNGEIQISDAVGGDACCGEGLFLRYYYKEDGNFICCNGILGYRQKGDKCCDVNNYFEQNSTCCDGNVFDKKKGDTCCHGSVYHKSKSSDTYKTICCANGPFGPFRTPACCKGIGYDMQGGTVCCGGRVYGKYATPACCVDQGYDVKTHQCCNGVIVDNPPGVPWAQCCGPHTFDHNTQICCDGQNVTVPAGIPVSRAKCCDFDTAYDPRTQLCCAKVRYDKLDRLYSQCCGEKMYDARKQVCCGDNVELKIREDGSIDLDTYPTLHDIPAGKEDTTKCCGMKVFDTADKVCCGGYIEDKVFPESDCCASSVQFDRTKSICCDNELQTIGPNVPWNRAKCCGRKCMFDGKQRCCQNRIYIGNQRSYETCEDFGVE